MASYIKLQTTENIKTIGIKTFIKFLQHLLNRFILGGIRYGPPNSTKKYLSRMKLELRAYEKTGNAEHLYNIAVYCGLEDQAPEHRKYHIKNTVDSVTRYKIN